MLPQVVIEAFPPSRLQLLNVIRSSIDDSMLREIAEADYGDRADQHEAALRPIRDHGELPDRFDWVPGEVLELIRWSEPTDLSWKPGRSGLEGHRMRGFACAALLATEIEQGRMEEATLAQSLRSEMELGGDENRALAGFLTYGIERLPSEFPWIAASGLLLVTLRLHDSGDDESLLRALAEWVVDDEQVQDALRGDLEYYPFGRERGSYRDSGREMRLAAEALIEPRLRTVFSEIADQFEK